MFDALHRSAGFFFYLLGSLLIAGLVYLHTVSDDLLVRAVLSSIDVPLLLSATLYGGMSMYRGTTKGRRSIPVAMVIALPLTALFLFFAYLNFAFPLKTLA